MATATSKKKVTRITGSQFFEAIGNKVGLKKRVIRDTVFALVDVVIDQLKKNEEVRIPHLGKLLIKNYPAKKMAAGNYPNPFKKDADGRPVMEYKEARTRPARSKLKFNVASQVKKPVIGK